MGVFLRAKFEAFSIILTGFRQGWVGATLSPPKPHNEPLKSPPTLPGLIQQTSFSLFLFFNIYYLFIFLHFIGSSSKLNNPQIFFIFREIRSHSYRPFFLFLLLKDYHNFREIFIVMFLC